MTAQSGGSNRARSRFFAAIKIFPVPNGHWLLWHAHSSGTFGNIIAKINHAVDHTLCGVSRFHCALCVSAVMSCGTLCALEFN